MWDQVRLEQTWVYKWDDQHFHFRKEGRKERWHLNKERFFKQERWKKIEIAYKGSVLPWGLRWYSICMRCERLRFDPWVGKIRWRRKWQPIPVFLPGEFHGQRSLAAYSSWDQRVRHDTHITLAADFSEDTVKATSPWIAIWKVPSKKKKAVSQNSVQFSHSVVSNSLRPHESQHARPSCPSPTPGVYPDSCPSSLWCHPAISSSVIPFSSCSQSFQASGCFPVSQLFSSGGQSIGVSASASALPMNSQDWSPLGWTGWISLQSKGLSRVFSKHHSSKAWVLRHSAFFIVQLSHPYMTTGKTIALTRRTFVDKVMSLLFNMLSRLVISFPPRSKSLLISWLQSPSAVILEPQKNKVRQIENKCTIM